MQHNVSLPAWSDAPELVKDGVLHVSIHVPAWGATTEFLAMRLPTMFQSTFPRGERHTANHGCLFWEMVSIHAPAWGATMATAMRRSLLTVSIHAPAWGATSAQGAAHKLKVVSIHAPAWGATLRRRQGYEQVVCFNPRSRVGSDRIRQAKRLAGAVSIHAPAWGATLSSSRV